MGSVTVTGTKTRSTLDLTTGMRLLRLSATIAAAGSGLAVVSILGVMWMLSTSPSCANETVPHNKSREKKLRRLATCSRQFRVETRKSVREVAVRFKTQGREDPRPFWRAI